MSSKLIIVVESVEKGYCVLTLFLLSFSASSSPFAIFLDSADPLKCTSYRSVYNELGALKKLDAYFAALEKKMGA